MFDNTHNLDGFIAKLMNFRQNIFPEEIEGVNFLFSSWHPNMALINAESLIIPLRFLVFPLIVTKFNINSVKGFILILSCKIDPSRNTILKLAILQLYLYFYRWELGYMCGYLASPLTKIVLDTIDWYFLTNIFTSFPIVELSEYGYTSGFGSPFPIQVPPFLFM